MELFLNKHVIMAKSREKRKRRFAQKSASLKIHHKDTKAQRSCAPPEYR